MPEDLTIESQGARLVSHLARPAGVARVPGLVLCHGFPQGPGGAAVAGGTYPALADRLSGLTGWAVLTFNYRGTGGSTGDFSVGGWLADIDAAVTLLDDRSDVSGVWLAGSATGGALCVVHAAEDDRVRGVVTLAAPATLRNWVDNAPQFLDHARRMGVIQTAGFPPDVGAWAREIAELDPLTAAAKIPPRPFLVLHGGDDDIVPPESSTAYAEAAGPSTEHRILTGGGHRLRHDPRAVALLAGWMSRQEQ
ncbi:MAG: alpha/beta hydrolase [Actinobacteria bacterium]|nr:alpha/beta hydrolase [Actinomycetota bacterium]